MLNLAIDNADKTLIKAIDCGEKDIHSMSRDEYLSLNRLMVNYPQYRGELTQLTEKLLSPIVEAYQYDEYHPYWFSGKTQFDNDIWRIKLGKTEKIIDFTKVQLDDGKPLTAHRPLLNTFKIWIVTQGNPRYNGGASQKPKTILIRINKVLTLIDAILLHAERIHLAKRHLLALDENLMLSILCNIAEHGIIEGVYCYRDRVSQYLLSQIDTVDDKELLSFEVTYPLVAENSNESELGLSLEQIRKARFWLFHAGAYKQWSKLVAIPYGPFFYSLYENTISVSSAYFPPLVELSLVNNKRDTEYSVVPVKGVEGSGIGTASISSYLTVLKSLSVVNTHSDTSHIELAELKSLSVKRINDHVELRETGRFTLLPASVVFKAVKDAFEFVFQYGDVILETALNCLSHRQSLKKRGGSYDWTEFKDFGWKTYLPAHLKLLGACQWSVSDQSPSCFEDRRANLGFCDLFNVLMGSIQILVGTVMARRQGELLELHPTDCLLPSGIDPTQNRYQEFDITFLNRKSGTGGEYALREELSKPILNSVAGWVYKLQKFNHQLIQRKVVKESELGIFNNINSRNVIISKTTSCTYNSHLDAFCDYFKTEVVEYQRQDFRRYYFRQHQLRRFFAMLFFWSKNYDGIDTLRHFLGHTDSEHLFHYITEHVTGEVLSGIKAKALWEHVKVGNDIKAHIENIEKLRPILEKHFGVRELEILSESEVIENYDEVSPLVQSLKDSMKAECYIAQLIDKHIIDLQPEFFTVTDENSNKIRDFHLVLRVNDEIA